MIKFKKQPDRHGEPVYHAVIEFGDYSTVIATMERENMYGQGVNMWGSSHRWKMEFPEMPDRVGDDGQVYSYKREYRDTLAECKEVIATMIEKAFGVSS
jgi:hypothetical protein